PPVCRQGPPTLSAVTAGVPARTGDPIGGDYRYAGEDRQSIGDARRLAGKGRRPYLQTLPACWG
ncbi:MAG TPA: hypothetical protein VGR07_09150, partial [Thermoanaerobaculia bacterium]|nr:hypothetical protein [Thermoanaerobaculia bacterium]